MLVYDNFLELMASENNMEHGMPSYSTNRNDQTFFSLNLLGSEIL
jgi:hypothetical protein